MPAPSLGSSTGVTSGDQRSEVSSRDGAQVVPPSPLCVRRGPGRGSCLACSRCLMGRPVWGAGAPLALAGPVLLTVCPLARPTRGRPGAVPSGPSPAPSPAPHFWRSGCAQTGSPPPGGDAHTSAQGHHRACHPGLGAGQAPHGGPDLHQAQVPTGEGSCSGEAVEQPGFMVLRADRASGRWVGTGQRYRGHRAPRV